MISCSQLVIGFEQFNKDCGGLPPNLRVACLSHQDGVPMVSTLMCIVTHYTRLMVNHDVKLLGCHDFPNYYVAWNIKSMLKSIGSFDLWVRS